MAESSMKAIRTKRCRVCKAQFLAFNSLAIACSPDCAIEYARKEVHRRAKAEQRQRKVAIKTRAQWAKEAQAAFNSYIRERDHDRPCISCGRHHEGQWHAGHYRSVGACPELRFEPANAHKQCAPCNNHKSGNVIEYRISLVQRIGAGVVEWLEGPHEPKRYTVDDLQQIKKHYTAEARRLRRERDTDDIAARRKG